MGSVGLQFDGKNPNDFIVIYCRVSTNRQGEDGESLEVQESLGIEFSKKLGLEPIVFKEVGSGNPQGDKSYLTTNERPKFQSIMTNVGMGLVKNIWVSVDDRLTRDKMDLSCIMSDFQKHKVNYYIGKNSKPKDMNDWTTDLIDQILVRVKQQYVLDLIERGNLSKRKKFKEGMWMKGPPPFGYKLVDKKLEVCENTSPFLIQMFRDYNSGISTWEISNYLFKEGIKPPRSNGEYWNIETINKISRNKTYIGIHTYGDLVGECVPLIDKKTFYSIQKKFQMMKQTKNMKTNFLLRGIMKCPDGKPCSCLSTNGTRKYELYSCVHRQRKYKSREKSVDCSFSKSIRRNLMDDYVWDTMCETLFNSHNIRQKVKDELLGGKTSYTSRTFRNKIKRLKNELMGLDKRRLELEKEYYSDNMNKKRFEVLNEVIEGKMEEIEKEITENEIKLDGLKNRGEWVNWLQEHENRIDTTRSITDYKGRLELVKHYIHEVSVLNYEKETHQHTLNINFKFPLFKDGFEWLRNKDGSFKLDRNGKRRFTITEGDYDMLNTKTLHNSLNGGVVNNGVFSYKPYLTISFIVVSHKFNPNQYINRSYENRQPIHNRINELESDGLGYRRIHKVLTDEKFDIGKSPTCVHTMMKKMKKRDLILNQKTTTQLDKIDIRLFQS